MAILVNGNGNARVYAAQDADLIASITGNTTVRTSVGNKMAATAADASTISVADGVIITKEGRRIQLDAGQTDLFTIPTGSVGVTNYYIIGYKLSQDADNVQVAETFVQLMASSTDTIPEGTFRGGDTEVYVSVARVEQDGVNLGTITELLPELGTLSEQNNDILEGLPVESDASSSANAYTTGQHFVLDGQYCVATANITIGDALVENTNYEEDSIGNAIEQINSDLTDLEKHTAGASVTIPSGNYTAPSDGYAVIEINYGSSSANYIQLSINGNVLLRVAQSQGSSQYASIFVRKGSVIAYGTNLSTGFLAYFVPLE